MQSNLEPEPDPTADNQKKARPINLSSRAPALEYGRIYLLVAGDNSPNYSSHDW